jgi:hypothetical protein
VKDCEGDSGGRSWSGAIVGSLVLVLLVLCGSATAQRPGPVTVVVFGDSQAQGLAYGLSRDLIDNPHIRVLNRTHPGAALVHGPSEWITPIRRFLAQDKTDQDRADIAVVMFGANDRIDMPVGDTGKFLRFRTPEWRAEYVKRVDQIMKALTDAGLKVIWCGNPIARSPTYSADMGYINQIFAGEAAHFGITFVPLWDAVTDPEGHYMAYGKDREGVTQRLRTDDGIHFTKAGYELVAEKLVGLFPPAVIHAAARSAP